MEIKSVNDKAFNKYGRVLQLEVPSLLEALSKTPLQDDVVYVASSPELEACAEFGTIQNSIYGGMPVQIGYCNGKNNALNAVEYHRDSEINIPLKGAIFMLGSQQDVAEDFTYDTSKIEVFEAPAGAVLEFYGTTLHYAPCHSIEEGFQVAVILPKGTNTDAPEVSGIFAEDKLMTAKNKWLISHAEAAAEDMFVGLVGENIKL
ncbi:MAG: DUF4867 family protein [Eubacteriales bacterium]